MPTFPMKTPFSAIWITRLSMEASTRPSTTSVSQSVISTPLSLISGPTMRRLTDSSTAGTMEDTRDGRVSSGSVFGTSILVVSAFGASLPRAGLSASCILL
ncbi:MAG: hypothetical protein A3I01_07115 [Betaproteobacteria bacterium RIFCSPLOWO2_02_FULL_65_24]|nr:MAG: hypothetical protein A3I01_07115 [Betaproteobacteria bacterium RIFCSPLOWO2_02_FULL_65_24]